MSSLSGLGRAGHDSELKLASEEQLSAIRRMAQIVARIFYDDRHIVLMDQLVSITVLPADVLAHRLGIQVKELAALSSKLLEDKLICTFRRNEIRDTITNRSVPRTYYYLDFKLFLNVTKWRMMSIRKKIDTRLRNELDNKGYVCPRCKKSYSTLEVAHLLDMFRNVFVCDTPGCSTELVDNEEAEDVKRSKDSLMRFNEQLSTLLGGLRRTEGITLPPLDVGAWLTKHAASQPWFAARSEDASSAPPSTVNGAPALQVDLASNDPAAEAARRLAKQKAEDEQRKQNALPAWHLASTVSGEQTALGRKQQRLSSSNGFDLDEGRQDDDADDDDYYAQYASLQTAEAAAAAAADSSSKPNQAPLVDEEEFDDFEPVTQPSTDAGTQRKRSRSRSASDADNKRAKSTVHASASGDNTVTVETGEDEDGMDDFEDVV